MRKLIIKGVIIGLSIMVGITVVSSCRPSEARVNLNFSDDFEGKMVDLITFEDSLVLASVEIREGGASFSLIEGDSLKWPVLAQFVVDGRVKGFYVIERGDAEWADTLVVAQGTVMNEQFSEMIKGLNEAEDAEDFATLTAIAEKLYNENKHTAIGSYFGVEWLKWADPQKVDSLLAEAPEGFRKSKRAERYIQYARLRARTAPGMPYSDFAGSDSEGNPIRFSKYIATDGITLVDFMASWCPYCIKDMDKLKSLSKRYKGEGLNLVSVAVRDLPEATAAAVKKHDISWPVIFDAQKRPYDLYGFSGIPHYILIGADGKILMRSESLIKIEEAIPELLSAKID